MCLNFGTTFMLPKSGSTRVFDELQDAPRATTRRFPFSQPNKFHFRTKHGIVANATGRDIVSLRIIPYYTELLRLHKRVLQSYSPHWTQRLKCSRKSR